jgi:hypothetical protein
MKYLTSDWKSDLHKLALGGAWLFIATTVLAMMCIVLPGSNAGPVRVLATTAHGQVYSAPLLSYSGWIGSAWAWTQLAGVLAAAAMSLLPWAKQQRIGHILLIGWCGLWAIGSMRLALVDPLFWSFKSAVLVSLLACTVYRAQRCWNPPAVPLTIKSEQSYFDRDLSEIEGRRGSRWQQLHEQFARMRASARNASQRGHAAMSRFQSRCKPAFRTIRESLSSPVKSL